MDTTTGDAVPGPRRSSRPPGPLTDRERFARAVAFKIRQARHNTGKSQRQIEADSGIPQGQLANYERASQIPSLPNLDRIARALGTTASAILDDDAGRAYRLLGESIAREQEQDHALESEEEVTGERTR
jgi:transcriptional regulator with XRE-family HTH domain